VKGAVRFLFSDGVGGMSFFLVFIMLANLLKIGGIALFTLNRKVDIHIRFFLVLLIIYLVFATGPLGASRFAVPLIPLVIFMTFTHGNLDVLKAINFRGRNR